MAGLKWDTVGSKRFEGGVDHGVLFTTDGTGIAWSGLTSVKENPSGGQATPYYLDGIKYLNVPSREDISGTIEAFTYPDEFGIHDGTFSFDSGLIATQQRRKAFALSYRTRIGNDLTGDNAGYKLHIIYNVLAEPSAKSYSSFGANSDPLNFSWNFTTMPRKPVSSKNLAPLSHVIIDSTKTSPSVLKYVEDIIYGTDTTQASLISMNDLFDFFDNPKLVFSIFRVSTTGLNTLVPESDGIGDLIGDPEEGLYDIVTGSRLTPTAIAGLYTLGS